MTAVPSYAERMSYLDHEMIVPTYSRFIPGVTVHRPMFMCPHCKAVREPLPAGETAVCVACDLHMQAGISYLSVWRPLNLGRIADPISVFALNESSHQGAIS